jgi:hypothetical protein
LVFFLPFCAHALAATATPRMRIAALRIVNPGLYQARRQKKTHRLMPVAQAEVAQTLVCVLFTPLARELFQGDADQLAAGSYAGFVK